MAAQDTTDTGGLRCWECGGSGHNDINCGRTCQYCHGLDHQTVQCRATVDREGRPLEDVLPKLPEEESRELIATMVRLFGGSVDRVLKKMKTKTRDSNTPLREDATARSLSAAIAAPTSTQGIALKRPNVPTSEDSPTMPAKKAHVEQTMKQPNQVRQAKLPPSATIPDKADRSAPSSAAHSEGPAQRKEQKPASLAKKTKKAKKVDQDAVIIFAPVDRGVWGSLSTVRRYNLLQERHVIAERRPGWIKYAALYENLKCPTIEFDAMPKIDEAVTVKNAKDGGQNLCFGPDGVIYWCRRGADAQEFAQAVRDGGLSPSIVEAKKNEAIMAAVGLWNPESTPDLIRIDLLPKRVRFAAGRPSFNMVDIPRTGISARANRRRPEYANEYEVLERPVSDPQAMGMNRAVTSWTALNQGDNLCFGPDGTVYLYLGGDLREFQRAVRDGGLSPCIEYHPAHKRLMTAVGFWDPAKDMLDHLPKPINPMKGKPAIELDPRRPPYRRPPPSSTFPFSLCFIA